MELFKETNRELETNSHIIVRSKDGVESDAGELLVSEALLSGNNNDRFGYTPPTIFAH
jgi:hypothetical protein